MSHILKVQITLLLMHYLFHSCTNSVNSPPYRGLECLKRELKHLQSQAISKGSRKTYSQGQRVYMSFCARFSFSPYPLCEDTLQLFTTYLAKSLSYASIRTYLSSLRLAQVELGLSPAPEMHGLKFLKEASKGSKERDQRRNVNLLP